MDKAEIRRRGSALIAAAAMAVAIGGLTRTASAATVRTWDGEGADNVWDTAANWSGNVLPASPSNTNQDTAQFSSAGALSITYGSTGNMGGAAGVQINVTAAQTGGTTLTNPTNSNFVRLQNITIANGAGAFTVGNDGGNSDFLALGAGSVDVFTWTNNSANTATIGNDVVFAYGGGDHENDLTLTGTGNWNFGAKFGSGTALNTATGTMRSFFKTGSGTVTITGDTRAQIHYPGTASPLVDVGAGRVFVKSGTMVIGNGGVLRSINPDTNVWTSIGQDGTDNGTLTLQGTGSFIADGDFNAGDVAASQGTVNIQDTSTLTVNTGGGFFIGSANAASSTATGTVNQSGGTVTVNASADGNFVIGGRIAGAAGTGTYNLSGTGVVTNLGRAWIGGYGNGSVVQTGGTWNNSESVSIARQAGSTGSYTISAGTLSQTGGTTGIVVGREGTGTLTVSGTAAVSTNAVLTVSGSGTGNGTVHLNGGTITTPSINSVAGTSTFNFNGGTLKAGASSATFMSGLTAANVRNGGAIIDSNTFDVVIAQPLQHSVIGGDNATDGGLTKNSAGAVVLTGAATYTGPTTINGGVLGFAAPSTVGAVTIADNAGLGARHTTGSITTLTTPSVTLGSGGSSNLTFDFNSLNSPTAAMISTGTFTANGTIGVDITNAALLNSGSYSLISYSSFAGSATFPAGTYNFSPRVTGTLLNNGTSALLLNVVADNPVWTGLDNNGTSAPWQVGTTGANGNWKLLSNAPTDYIEGDAVTFNDSATGVTTVDIAAANVSPVAVVFNNSTKNYTITGAFGIAGTGSIVKNGTGTTTISNTNSFSGGTTVNNGTLVLNAADAAGTGAVNLVGGTLAVNHATGLGTGALNITGGTLDNLNGSPVTVTSNNAQNWDGDFSFAGSNDLNMGTGLVSLGGSGLSRTITVNAGTLTVGRITGATKGLTKAGAGRLALTMTSAASSNIAGTLNVTGGVLQLNTGVDSATTNDFHATGLTGTGTIENGGGSERWLYVNTSGNDTFAGTLQDGAGGGPLGLNKQGVGTLTLSGNNTLTGRTTISAGTLVAASHTALGATARIIAAPGVSTTFKYATDSGGDNEYKFTLTTGTPTTVLNIVADRATPGAAVNRTMTTPADPGMGGGIINFTAGANVTSGTPRVTITDFNLGADTDDVTTTLNPTTANVTLGNVSKTLNNNPQTLILDGTSAGNEVTGIIANGNVAGSITKSNTSTWTLKNANTYGGVTTLTGGTLIAAHPQALQNTTRLNVLDSGGGATFRWATDGGDTQLAIGMGSGSNFNVISDRENPGAAVDRLMSVVTGSGLGGGTINFTAGANVTSGTPRITFNQFGLGAGAGGTTTTLNPTTVNLSVGNISKFNNNTTQTIDFGGTTTGNLITGTIANGLTAGAIVSVRKTGTSTWEITGTNHSYTGSTTVLGGTLRSTQSITTTSSINATLGTFQLASTGNGNNTIKTPTVTAVGGKIDLQNNKGIITAGQPTTLATVSALVALGRNGGAWDGNGIMTGRADAPTGVTGIATALNSDLAAPKTNFGDQSGLAGTDVLLMYTYMGDADLDADIDGDDFAAIDAGYSASATVYSKGDFNYSGNVDADDYFLIDRNYMKTGTVLLTPGPIAGGVTAVPEPATGAIIGLAAAALMRRRRRN